MIRSSQFERLAKFTTASWAIWSKDFDEEGCLEFEKGRILPHLWSKHKSLKENVVLLGLNLSVLEEVHQGQKLFNFHSCKSEGRRGARVFDYNLNKYIQKGRCRNLMGAYMTDLALTIGPNASKISVTRVDLKRFERQMKILGAGRIRVICFGRRVFNELRKNFEAIDHDPISPCILRFCMTLDHGRIHLDVYGVWHYSDRGSNHSHVLELGDQLESLDSRFKRKL